MNMVGYKGRGVSGWLAEAMSYAMTLWAGICESAGEVGKAAEQRQQAEAVNTVINAELWDGAWYGRGITDDGVLFGVSGRQTGPHLPQRPELGHAVRRRRQRKARETARRDRSPARHALWHRHGWRRPIPKCARMSAASPRNGRAAPRMARSTTTPAIFYAAALFHCRETDRAFSVLDRMLTRPDETDMRVRGQIPIYIPNYYRGAYYQFPRTAGRSSNLFKHRHRRLVLPAGHRTDVRRARSRREHRHRSAIPVVLGALQLHPCHSRLPCRRLPMNAMVARDASRWTGSTSLTG